MEPTAFALLRSSQAGSDLSDRGFGERPSFCPGGKSTDRALVRQQHLADRDETSSGGRAGGPPAAGCVLLRLCELGLKEIQEDVDEVFAVDSDCSL